MNTPRHFSSCVAEYDPNALLVSAAQEIVCQWALPRGRAEVEHVRLFDALDRVLAEDVISPINVPSHDNSALDGYAFDGAVLSNGANGADESSLPDDAPLRLTLAGTALAGQPFEGRPLAANIVRGANRRLAGEDLAQGQAALRKGRIVRASDLGLLVSLGIDDVAVQRRLRVAFFQQATNCVRLVKHSRRVASTIATALYPLPFSRCCAG